MSRVTGLDVKPDLGPMLSHSRERSATPEAPSRTVCIWVAFSLRCHMPRAGVESIQFGPNFGVPSISGTWKPSAAERNPVLTHWESRRPVDQSPAAREEAWEREARLRWEIEQTRQRLVAYTDLLTDPAGVQPPTAYPTN
jgi:hypothetical protein